jgi:hypothetical protein
MSLKPDQSFLEIVLKSNEPASEPSPIPESASSPEPMPFPAPELSPSSEPSTPDSKMGSVLRSPTLVDALRAFIVNFHHEVSELTEEMKQKFQIVITPETLSMLEYVLNNYPDDITNIHIQLNTILDDGKINISDVPSIIKLMSSVYNLLLQKRDEFKDPERIIQECSIILKMTFYVLVKSENVSTGKISQEEFITIFNNIVDSCFFIASPYVPKIANDFKTRCVKLFACFSKS